MNEVETRVEIYMNGFLVGERNIGGNFRSLSNTVGSASVVLV